MMHNDGRIPFTSIGTFDLLTPVLETCADEKFLAVMGCSLFWWVGEGDDPKTWKIKKEVEYKKVV